MFIFMDCVKGAYWTDEQCVSYLTSFCKRLVENSFDILMENHRVYTWRIQEQTHTIQQAERNELSKRRRWWYCRKQWHCIINYQAAHTLSTFNIMCHHIESISWARSSLNVEHRQNIFKSSNIEFETHTERERVCVGVWERECALAF